MSQMVKFGIVLAVICCIATFVLAVTHQVTSLEIEKKLKEEERVALNEIIPESDAFTEKKVDDVEYFEALKDSELIGYCVKAVGTGYSGFIRMIVGIDPSGTIKGVRVLEHIETPGLGAKIVEVRVGEDEPYFLRQFKGKSAKTVTMKKDVDAITGATISSTAVSDAINKTVNEFFSKAKR